MIGETATVLVTKAGAGSTITKLEHKVGYYVYFLIFLLNYSST